MRTVAGLTLVVIGMIGTLVPIIPGLPLVVGGIALLGPGHRLTRALTRRLRAWRRRRDKS